MTCCFVRFQLNKPPGTIKRGSGTGSPKDVQIAFENVGMTQAGGFGRQTLETGFGFVTGVKVKIIYIYIYICTHFATSSNIHILLGVLSLSPQHFFLSILPDTN